MTENLAQEVIIYVAFETLKSTLDMDIKVVYCSECSNIVGLEIYTSICNIQNQVLKIQAMKFLQKKKVP